MSEQVFVYRWKNNAERATLFGRLCRITASGAMNTVAVKFLDNGMCVTTSWRALRKQRKEKP